MDLNLNSAAAADDTSKFSDTIKVYDSLGTTHVLTVHFQKTGANQWSYNVTIPGEEISGGTAGTPFDISGASGTLTFGTDGQLTSPAAGTPIAFDIPGLTTGAADMNLEWNPYTSTRKRAHHAVRPALGAFGQFAERFGGRAIDPRRTGRRRQDPGAVFGRRAGGGGTGGAGQRAQSRIADRRRATTTTR